MTRYRWKGLATILMTLAVLGGTAFAMTTMTYEIARFSVVGGGGTASGGTYTLVGAAGQPDAGGMSGGSYSLVGGALSSGVATATPTATPTATATPAPTSYSTYLPVVVRNYASGW